ncbi:MAG: SGNH/GDSL hydrolase family protein [Polyangiales bacterium]
MTCRAVFLLWLCVGCREPPRSLTLSATDPRVLYTGLFDRRALGAARFSWEGSRIDVAFESPWLRVRLEDTPVEDETRELDLIDVTLDDQPTRVFALAEGAHVYPLATGLPAGPHRVSISKRTEPEVGVIALRGFEIAPSGTFLAKPPTSPRALYFVGDSVTAGYGNLGADGSCHFSVDSEDNLQTYGAVAASDLGASYTALAWSGKGLTRNYEARDETLLPALLDLAIPTEVGSARAEPRPAHAVVVNLGTNDFFRGIPDERAFVRAYLDLLARLRARNPSAWFVLVLGPMLADDIPQPRARSLTRQWLLAIREQRRAAGDSRVDLLEQWIDPTEGFGCDFHPNVKTHARLGHELSQLLRDRLGW